MRLLLVPVALTGLLAACDAPAPQAADPNEVAAPASEPGTAAEAGEAVPMPAGLNSEERFIWSTLTPQAQRDAAEFIANGGTLLQFINA